MGWASGSMLMSSIITRVQEQFPDDEEVRKKLYEILIESFEDVDCDTLDECRGEDDAYDTVFDELYPPDEEDFDDETLWDDEERFE